MTELMKMVAANLITYVLVVLTIIMAVLGIIFLVPWQDVINGVVSMVWKAVTNK